MYFSFVYFYPTSIIGPGFEFMDFKNWIELTGHYKTMTPKIAIKEGLKRLVIFILLIINFILNLVTGYSYSNSIFPYAGIFTYASQAAAFVLCLLTFFFSEKYFLY